MIKRVLPISRFAKRSMCIKKQNIVNSNLPKCVDCVHYIPPDYEFISNYAKCKEFGKMEITTGKITNEFTDNCRQDKYKCGLEGKNFVKEEYIKSKKLKHIYNMFKFPIYLGLFFTAQIFYLSKLKVSSLF